MTDPFAGLIDSTLVAHSDAAAAAPGLSPTSLAFQWPWDIAKAGAGFLKDHGAAVKALVSGGTSVSASPQGSALVKAISNAPTSTASTGALLNDGIFTQALSTVSADQLLRTVFIGWSTGAQVGLFGGGGGSGVAYDIVDNTNFASVSFGSFNLGIGGGIAAGLLLGAMSPQPRSLNYSTNVWQFAASLGVSVTVTVMMNSDNLSLIGFAINLGGGGGISSSTGYGKISAQ